MTTLYKPVLIESAEQADQLPEGTFIIDSLDLVARLEKTGRYAGRWLTEEDGCLNDPVMPAQALVPVEVKEQWCASWPEDDAHQRCRDERTARLWEQQQDAAVMSRLVTPWKPA